MRAMIYKINCTLTIKYSEQLTEQGIDGLPDLIRVMVNEAMVIERENHLGAKP
jgi:putative transposase